MTPPDPQAKVSNEIEKNERIGVVLSRNSVVNAEASV
jgi:hypothetical protein